MANATAKLLEHASLLAFQKRLLDLPPGTCAVVGGYVYRWEAESKQLVRAVRSNTLGSAGVRFRPFLHEFRQRGPLYGLLEDVEAWLDRPILMHLGCLRISATMHHGASSA